MLLSFVYLFKLEATCFFLVFRIYLQTQLLFHHYISLASTDEIVWSNEKQKALNTFNYCFISPSCLFWPYKLCEACMLFHSWATCLVLYTLCLTYPTFLARVDFKQ